MKENYSKKHYIWVLIVCIYFMAELFIKDYLAEKELDKFASIQVFKEYEPHKYKKLLDALKDYKAGTVNQDYYSNYVKSIMQPTILEAKNKMYLFADDMLIYDYANLLRKILNMSDTEKCYDFFYSQYSSKSQFLTEDIKVEFEVVSSRILKSYYEKKEHKLISEIEYKKEIKDIVKNALDESKVEMNLFEKNNLTYKEKKELCKFDYNLYNLLIENKKIDLLRYNLKDMTDKK